MEFGDSDKARVGDWVIAIGNPFGLGGTVTAGIVSARGRDIQAGPYDDFLQTRRADQPGQLRRPDLRLQGRVIGINTAIFSPIGGIGRHRLRHPVQPAKAVIAQLRENGTVSRGWLGVQIQQVTPEIADSLGLPAAQGRAGRRRDGRTAPPPRPVQAGDVILSLDSRPVDTIKDLTRMVADAKTGSNVTLEVLRKGKRQNISVKLDSDARPAEGRGGHSGDAGTSRQPHGSGHEAVIAR